MNALQIIQQKLKAPKGQYNSFGKYNYRNQEDILEAVKPLLADTKSELIITDEIVELGGSLFVKSTAFLKEYTDKPNGTFLPTSTNQVIPNITNTWTATAYAMHAKEQKGMNESQITGAASSYARKYALNGLFLIDDTKDADATNDGTKKEVKAKPDEKKTSNPPTAPKKELDWLNEGTENWKHVVKRLTDKESPMTIEQVKQQFRISKASEEKLKAL